MKIYLAGTTVSNPQEEEIIQSLFKRGCKLHSYFHCVDGFEKNWFEMNTENKVQLFLDSGAFSAWSQDSPINIDEYIAFIKENESSIDLYANLDVIGSAQGTWQNQVYIEKAGLNPLPTFHYGEDIKWLQRYLSKGYDYICLGGMVPISTRDLKFWLDDIFSNYICDSSGMPKVKVHGFGLTSFPLMMRYPWYSVDSTSWVVTGRMGSIYVPRKKGGEWVYNENSWKIAVSNQSPNKKEAGAHIDTMSPGEKQIILDYIEEKGYCLGKSEYRMEFQDYKLQDNEKWAQKKPSSKTEKRKLEIILEDGISNRYQLRDEMNIIYFLDLEKSMPEWPWAFKMKQQKGFF
jgi:hypothetical protein